MSVAIKVKMLRSNNAGYRSIKKVLVGERGREKGVYSCFSKSILLDFRARAVPNSVSFFF
jgi:hypothetical protein